MLKSLNRVLENYKQLLGFLKQIVNPRIIIISFLLFFMIGSLTLYLNMIPVKRLKDLPDESWINPSVALSITEAVKDKNIFIDGYYGSEPGELSFFNNFGAKIFISCDSYAKNEKKIYQSGLLILNYAIGKPELTLADRQILKKYLVNGGRILLMCPIWVWSGYDHKDMKKAPYYEIAEFFGLELSNDYVIQPLKFAGDFNAIGLEPELFSQNAFSSIRHLNSNFIPILEGQAGQLAAVAVADQNNKLVFWSQNNLLTGTVNSAPHGKKFVNILFNWLFDRPSEYFKKPQMADEILKSYPHEKQNMGTRQFPNQKGLIAWKIIAAIFWGLAAVFLIMKRKYLLKQAALLIKQNNRIEIWILWFSFPLALWALSGLWRSGLPASWDACQHFVRCLVTKDVLLSNFKIVGWSPCWYLGLQQFLFYSPLLFVLISLAHLMSFELIPFIIWYKLFYFLVFWGVAPASYWLMRKINIPPLPSAFAALGALSFSAIHGIGIESLFVAGLLTQGFGLILFAVVLGCLIRLTLPDAKVKDAVWFGLFTGLLALSHVISTFYLGLCILVFALANLVNKRFFALLLLGGLLSLLISAFQIWPTWYFKELKPPGVGWGNFNFFAAIFSGAYFSSILVNIFAVVGLGIALLSKNRTKIALAVLAIITYLLASATVTFHSDLYYLVFRHRTFPYLALYFVVFTGIFYDFAFNFIKQIIDEIRLAPHAKKEMVKKIAIVVFMVLAGFTIIYKIAMLKERVRVYSDFDNPLSVKFHKAFDWVKNNVPENAVLTMDMRMEGGPHLLNTNFINIFGDRYNLHGESGFRPGNEHFDLNFAKWESEKLYKYSVRYNTSYFISWTEDVKNNLKNNSDLFRPVYFNDPVIVWQVMGHDFRCLDAQNIAINDFYFSPELIKWRLDNNKQNNEVIAAVSYHPNWHLYVNGERHLVKRTSDGIMSFILPDKGRIDLILKFERTLTERILYVVSALTLLFVIFTIMKKQKER